MSDTRVRVRSLPSTSMEEREDVSSPLGSRSPGTGDSEYREYRRDDELPTAAELFVPSLPGLPNMAAHPTHPLEIYSGLLPSYPGEGQGGGEGTTGKDAKLYFLMSKARRSAGRSRVIFWFNGGPGCSSFDGSLMEVGPFRTVPASETTSGQVEVRLVEGGWEEFATVVFVDQPPGTGLSQVPGNGYLHEYDQLAAHFIHFLQNFYKVFPELEGVDTYLAGESFAGQYIPVFASSILSSPLLPSFPLKGIAIGNGWIDPILQYPAYVDFAYEKGLIEKGSADGEKMESALARCQEEMQKYDDPMKVPVNIDHCGEVMDSVSDPFTQELNGKKVCMNVYDVRLVDDWPACGMNWPPDLTDVYAFLRQDETVQALHASKQVAWVECSNKVSHELRLQNSYAASALLPGILENGVEILMFAGAEDLICNYKGIERIVNSLEWNGEVGFDNATALSWTLNDTEIGTWTTSRNLTYAKIYDSSHMVGFDKPHATNDMIMRFMGVDLGDLVGGTARWESSVGGEERLGAGVGVGGVDIAVSGGDDGGTDWEARYNSFSAMLVLLILSSIIGLYFYFRRKPLRRSHPTSHYRNMSNTSRGDDGDASERVPLGHAVEGERDGGDLEMEDLERAEGYEFHDSLGMEEGRAGKGWKGKGKKRQSEDGEREVVFALGDDET